MRNQNNQQSIVALIIGLVGLLPMNLLAQVEAKDITRVRFVNLVATGEGDLTIRQTGASGWERDFYLGKRTGAIGLEKGTYEYFLSKKGCTSSSKEVALEAGKAQTLVTYSEPLRDDTGNVVSWELKIARLGQYDAEDGRYMTIVSFCEAPKLSLKIEEIMGGTESNLTVPRLKVERVKLPQGDSLSRIFIDGEQVTKLGAREKGNYVVLLYEDEEGKKSSVNFYDPKFVLAE